MEWQHYPYFKPEQTSSYHLSLNIENFHPQYVAWYDQSIDKWYKYDPFNNERILDEIPNKLICGWMKITPFLG